MAMVRRGSASVSSLAAEPAQARFSNRRETVAAVVAVVAVAVGIGFLWMSFWGGEAPYTFFDLNLYRDSVNAVANGTTATYAALPYPPLAFLLLWFLRVVPPVVGDQLWLAASLMMLLVVAVVLTAREMEARGQDWREQRAEWVIRSAATAIILTVSMPVASQLTNGQMSLVVLTLAFVDTAGVLPRRFQGALVGLAGALKVTPLVFVVYYLVTGQRRQAVVAMGSFAAFTAIGWAVFPAASLQFWTRVGGSEQFGDPARTDNLSIHSALARISPQLGEQTWLWLALGGIVMLAALWRARRHFRRGEAMESVLVVGAAAAVVAPIAWPHYFIWLPMTAIWLWVTGTRLARWIGAAIYVAYSMIYVWVLVPLLALGSAVLVPANNLLVLIPVLIGILGLPRAAKPSLDTVEPAPKSVTQIP
jgi:alpha-1,2-mannosyltransferase